VVASNRAIHLPHSHRLAAGARENAVEVEDASAGSSDDDPIIGLDDEVDAVSRFHLKDSANLLGNRDLSLGRDGGDGHDSAPYLS
jgi:hypothetical protein